MNHRHSIGAAIVSLALTGLLACGSEGTGAGTAAWSGGDDGGGASDGGATSDAATPSDGGTNACNEPAAGVCSDAQVAAIAAALNQGEVLEAQVVLDKGQRPEVRSFAQKMATDHTMLLNAATKLFDTLGITPEANGISQELTEGAHLEAQNLSSKGYAEIDASYVNAEVVDHIKALAMIRWVLIPSAQNADVRAALVQARDVVAGHLQAALELQRGLLGQCGSGATTGGDAGCDTDGGTTSNDDGGTSTGDGGGTWGGTH